MKKAERLRKNTIKAGVRASREQHHLITPQELLGLKIQVLPGATRAAVCVAGLILLFCALLAWPLAGNIPRFIEGFSGVLLTLAGLIGIRRTFGGIIDGLGNIGAEAAIDGIISSIAAILD